MKYVFIFGLVFCIVKLNKCLPYNSSVISKYARVSVWGNNNTLNSGIRNSKSGNIWNHRLDQRNTTRNKNPAVAYQYPVYQKPESKIDQQIEHVPGIGEVIVAKAQDRFEARPLFAYRNKIASATYLPPAAPKSTPNSAPVTRSPPVAAPPPPPPAAPDSGRGSYNSPYNSYNPPDFKQDDSDNSNLYPPNAPPNSDDSSMVSSPPGPPVDDQKTSNEESRVNKPDSYVSFGPPLASYEDDDDHSQPHDHYGNDHDHDDHAQDPMAMYKYQDGPPQHPPKSVDDIYYPPDFPKNQIHDMGGDGHMNQNPHDNDMMPPDDQGMGPPNDHGMMLPDDHGMMPPDDMVESGKSNGDDPPPEDSMPPPPSHDYDHGHAFPQYLYDHHHYDNHVYEEIPHTTMAPAKEDKRVSSTNYSYYYLGRKLYYIPLYFSIYFIIYVTVLILKSIARHKVRLKYKWYEHDISAKQARSMDLGAVRDEQVTNIHKNVSVALKNATAKYDSVIAM